jgi:glyoxylase-like metal-dependent hydrolase (beta-lactamase superfamily II)
MPDIVLRLGRLQAWLLDCGCFRYDGGVIFGAVPRTAWEQHYAPGADNQIVLGLRPLLIRDGEEWLLVNTGAPVGDPEFSMESPSGGGVAGPTTCAAALARLGVRAEQVSAVVLTHLHPDHVAGNLERRGAGLAPAFARARYVVQRDEAAAAAYPNERTRADYELAQLRALEDAGVLQVVAGLMAVSPGVSLLPAPGHTPGHQCVRLASDGQLALYVSDLAILPVQAERLAWISALDTHPMTSLESKRELLGRACSEGSLLLFEHEPDAALAVGRLLPDGKRWHYEAGQ